MVELSKEDRLGIFLMPPIKFRDALLVLMSFVCYGFRYPYASYKADAEKCTDILDNREMELDQIFQPNKISK